VHSDAEFLAAFEAAAIPSERWKHRDHVRMAFLYLRDLSFDEALSRIRAGIRALNRANGVEDTPTEGYHETATVAWAHVIASCIVHHGRPPATADFESFAQANPQLCARTLLRGYYTRERILSPEARATFVEPDLAPLPRLC
jgi:hypothetical protein